MYVIVLLTLNPNGTRVVRFSYKIVFFFLDLKPSVLLVKHMRHCAVWYNLYNLNNVKNIHGGVLLLVKLQASGFIHVLPNVESCHVWVINIASKSNWNFIQQL